MPQMLDPLMSPSGLVSYDLYGGKGAEGDLLGEFRTRRTTRLDHRLEGLSWLQGEQSCGCGQFPEPLREAAARMAGCGGACAVVLQSSAVQDIQTVVGPVNLGGGCGIDRQAGTSSCIIRRGACCRCRSCRSYVSEIK